MSEREAGGKMESVKLGEWRWNWGGGLVGGCISYTTSQKV